MDLRRKGSRQTTPRTNTAAHGPLGPLDNAGFGEVQISADQMKAINHLYQTNPSMQAARSILMGQLLSSGVVIRRDGKDVELTEAFAKHLEGVWIPFARNVVDSFLQYGFAVVSIEEEDPEPFGGISRLQQRALRGPPNVDAVLYTESTPFNGAGSKRPRSAINEPPRVTQVPGQVDQSRNLIPVICEVGTYQLSYVMGGRAGYKRDYRVSSMSATHAYEVDDSLGLFFRTQPDHNGNINSPVATCFDAASFVAALQEMALNAEVTRSRTQIVTQSVPKPPGAGSLGPESMFWDSESRNMIQGDQEQGNTDQAAALSMIARMCSIINTLQTTNPGSGGGGPGAREGAASHVPPELPPRLFTVPEKQQIVPNLRPPESRSDLEALYRWSNDAICAAMGVPASIIFEGKFSSNSMSQLQLLNTTISSLAINVNNVLTRSYHACYGRVPGSTDEDELMLVTAPLSATTEIEALYAAQIIDVESALPAALHSLGCSANEISEALKRRLEKEKQRGDAESNALLAESDLKAAQSAKTTEEIEAVRAGVEKTRAETKAIPVATEATAEQAKASAYASRKTADNPPPKPAGSAGGAGGGGGGNSK